jgi:hypothetical protein
MHWFLVAALVATVEPAAAPSSSPPPSPEEQKKLEEEIAKELGAAPGGSAATPAPAPGQQAPGGAAQPATGGNPYARILMLPDISAIGDFAGTYHSLDVGQLSPRSGLYGAPHEVTPHFQELELGLQSVIDPYARADIFISFTPGGVDVEEAYLTTLTLPAGFQVRAGKFLSPFGRLNQQHPHVWDFVDAPLAMDRLLSVDSLKGPGVDVAWLAPLPWFAELHLAGQTTRPSFVEEDRRTLVARLQQFFDVGEGATLGVGLSGARIQEPLAGASREVGGADFLLKFRPVSTRSYLVLQGEVFARRMRETEEAGTVGGGYLQAVFRDGPFYAYGVRGELAPAAEPGTTVVRPGAGTERRVSALAEWLPSEFQRIRAQAAWDHLPDGRDGFEGTLHLEFVIGAHGAHPF